MNIFGFKILKTSDYKASFKIKRFYKIGQAAIILGVSIDTLRDWDKSGKLYPSVRTMAGHRLYRYSDLQKFINKK